MCVLRIKGSVLQLYVPEGSIGNVANEDPSDLEYALPFVGSPDRTATRVVHLCIKGK